MKEYKRVYKNSKGMLSTAMSGDFLIEILLVFWFLPIVAIIMCIWHFFKDNTMMVSMVDYHKHQLNYYQKKEKEETK